MPMQFAPKTQTCKNSCRVNNPTANPAMSSSMHWHSRLAATALHQGGLIAYPTEAVWGVGCDPWNAAAVDALLALKQRPIHKGMILIAADMGQLSFLLQHLPPEQQATLDNTWPGFATWLIPDHQRQIPGWIRGDSDAVAVRVSAHPGVRALCRAFGGPIVSTSANPAGRPPATRAWQVRHYFSDDLDYLLPGTLGGERRPSIIRDLVTGDIIRS